MIYKNKQLLQGNLTNIEEQKVKDLADGQISAKMTTTIDSSSTDTEIPSAKSVFDNVIRGIRVYQTTIDSYGTEILKYPLGKWFIIPSLASQFTDLPVKASGIIDIESISTNPNVTPWDSAGCSRLYTLKTYSGDTYIRKIYSGSSAGEMSVDTGWQRLCTTTVPDVAKTLIVSTNSGIRLDSNSFYSVVNGICHVTLWTLYADNVDQSQIIISDIPVPNQPAGAAVIAAVNDGVIIGFAFVDQGKSNLYIHVYNAGIPGYCSFSYPVAES